MQKHRYIANGFTIIRFVLIIPISITLCIEQYLATTILLIFGAFTDFLDGYYARKSQSTSSWGAMYDPLADKVLLLSPLFWLISNNLIPFWSVSLLITRELIVTSKRKFEDSGLPAIKIAKAKTLLQFLSITLFLFSYIFFDNSYFNLLNNIALSLYWSSFALSMYTGFKYIF